MVDDEPWRPRRKWRRHLYYKVQIFDPVSMTWRDEKPAFDVLDDAQAYISEKVAADAVARVMQVDGRSRTPVDNSPSDG